MSIKKSYNFLQVNEQVSSSGTIKHIELIDEGFKLVVNLLPDDSEHARANEKQQFESLNVDYNYIPVDWNNPLVENYNDFEEAMNQHSGEKVHIHCAANYRATAFYGIYAYKNLGWTETQLNELMSSIWSIDKYPQWQKFVSTLIAQ